MAGDTIIEDTGVFRIAYMLVLVMMVCNRRSEVRGEHVGGVRLAKDDEVSFMIASIAYCVHGAQGLSPCDLDQDHIRMCPSVVTPNTCGRESWVPPSRGREESKGTPSTTVDRRSQPSCSKSFPGRGCAAPAKSW